MSSSMLKGKNKRRKKRWEGAGVVRIINSYYAESLSHTNLASPFTTFAKVDGYPVKEKGRGERKARARAGYSSRACSIKEGQKSNGKGERSEAHQRLLPNKRQPRVKKQASSLILPTIL
ncbi:hypothetical protein TEQG_02367 [Trichophyton equinum CBS 127.97]|uniref:Uncharacterized protein n=1 Tax=Trichophyton equinum (strain ATCC MYA-4606 / CBS 127.97) TaxID=559882 RepID=F2PN66_TRIEC|nr:hypothetical protein TEQG_02367 [Trichophyton equinum CBS 127.97]